MPRVSFGILLFVGSAYSLVGAPCATATLTTYLNGGNPFTCEQSSGNIVVSFNHDLLPSYVGLNLLAGNNSAADPNAITVVPGSPGLFFNSSSFTTSNPVAGAQSELVHFSLSPVAGLLTSTTFSLQGVSVGTGSLGLGSALALGQEIVCIGGNFTSLPTGLVTSVANGVLPGNPFGCNGVAMVGTAAVTAGPLNALTAVLGLPDLTGLTDQAIIAFTPPSSNSIDVIKIQALVSVTGGVVSTTGFGDTFDEAGIPEPGSVVLTLLGVGGMFVGRRIHARRS